MTEFETLDFIADCGVEVIMLGKKAFSVGGFYRSGSVVVTLGNPTRITSHGGQVTEVPHWSNLLSVLLELNDEWFIHSKHESSTWTNRHPGWEKVRERLEDVE